ncbi:plasmid recombination protein [Deltaproteobacteria bacterium OttesenSCG-928-K17]|nr:plasmid recombination protein [Deltaproteobacteria bacterium OttesenSCG-928-K17]
MSLLVFHMEKYKRDAVRGIQSHNQRERKSASNPDIDYDRSGLNYDLHNSGPADFGKVIDQRIGQLVLNKKIRHDAVYMCGLMVSSDSEFFKKLSPNETRRFFGAAYEYLSDFVGKENVISAVVHLDETTPHMHFAHVPVTHDGRLAANKIYDRKDETLARLHDGLSARLKEYGFKIERGGRGKGKVHLNTKEFKEQREALKDLDAQAEAKRQELASTQTELNQALAHLRELSEQAREAELILQQEPEPPKPTMLNYKSVCDGHVQRLEILKKALADKRAIEDRNRKLEASHKAIASELKVLRMKDSLDEMEKSQAVQDARKELQRVEDEKRQLKAALAEAREFINQPEVQAMYEKYQARQQERTQARAQEAPLAPPRAPQPEEQRPGVSMGR